MALTSQGCWRGYRTDRRRAWALTGLSPDNPCAVIPNGSPGPPSVPAGLCPGEMVLGPRGGAWVGMESGPGWRRLSQKAEGESGTEQAGPCRLPDPSGTGLRVGCCPLVIPTPGSSPCRPCECSWQSDARKEQMHVDWETGKRRLSPDTWAGVRRTECQLLRKGALV